MTTAKKRIVLAGATGYIGRAVAAELLDRGHELIAIVRDPAAAISGGETRLADVTDAAGLSAALAQTTFDAVISCIASRTGVPDDAWRVDCEANRNLLATALRQDARQFILLSAICVQKPRLAFQYAKLAFEADLVASGIDYTIVRPTAFFKSLSGQVERVRKGKSFLIFGDGTETACKPIGRGDLARYLVDCLDDPSARGAILPIAGPGEALTPREQGQMLFELADMPPQFRRVPPQLFRVATAALAPLGTFWPGAARKAELARIGHYYATESMLVWDEARGEYDARSTPSTGKERLRDHYARMLHSETPGKDLGSHKLF
ncbi:MAG: NAD(P)H-binding protein [Woeseiaceae bacterium]